MSQQPPTPEQGEFNTVTGHLAPWPRRLELVMQTMRELSLQSDPAAAVSAYAARMRTFYGYQGIVAISRRFEQHPLVRVTRSHTFTNPVDPWRERHKLPLLRGGLFAKLIYDGQPVVIPDLDAVLEPNDPCRPYVEGFRSLIAVPHFDAGEALNMVCTLRREAEPIDPERLPELVWLSGLFGRGVNNMVLSRQLREANALMDREMRVVADIQRSLLPVKLPELPKLELAADYQTSKNAGGDYYDFFELPDGRLGILIADVSGHGTPAAVLMAILHAVAHSMPTMYGQPANMLAAINKRLCESYTGDGAMFVTAFYGVYDPRSLQIEYSSAGHNPPLVFCGRREQIRRLEHAQGLPLGIIPDTTYEVATEPLQPADTIMLYTDGITEARNRAGTMYTEARLANLLARCAVAATAADTLDALQIDLEHFCDGVPANDDRTMLVAKVR